MKKAETVIFDVDGVIVESEDLHRIAYNRAFQKLGLDLSWQPETYGHLLHLSGGKKLETIDVVVDRSGSPGRAGLINRIYDMKKEEHRCLIDELAVEGKLESRPGIVRLIKEVKEAGCILAAASTCEKRAATGLIRGVLGEEIYAAFDCICAGDDVKARKPAPDIYLLVLRVLKADPGTAIAIEDTLHGLRAAHAAGIRCVVTPSEYTLGQDFSEAELCVGNLDGKGGGPVVTFNVINAIVYGIPPAR